jgi:hypothetical protein
MTTEYAVIDRFEGELAVLLVGEQHHPLDIPRSLLPHRVREGDYLRIERRENEIIGVTVDEEATERARKRIAEKLDRLRRGDHLKDEV